MATVIQFCNRCEERKYLKLCKKCLQYLCGTCKKEHFCGVKSDPQTVYSSSEHIVKQIDNRPFQCKAHLKEVIRFCFTCTNQLCEECLDNTLSVHKGHAIYNVENAAKEIRKQTDAKIASVKVQIDQARKQRHELDKHRFSSSDRNNTRRQVNNLASNLASAIVAAIEDQSRLNKTVIAESANKLQKSIDIWTDMSRTLHKISVAPNDLDNIQSFCNYIKVHENLEIPTIKTKAEFPDERKFQHSEMIQKELLILVEYLESITGINIPLIVKTEEEIERLATAYDREEFTVDLATHPVSRAPSRSSHRTNLTYNTSISKIEDDSLRFLKSENQALKMEISKLHKQLREIHHATSLLSNYCTNVLKFTLSQEDDILDALRKPMTEDDDLTEFYRNISTVGESFANLKSYILNVEERDTDGDHDDNKSIQTRLTIDTLANHSTVENQSFPDRRTVYHSIPDMSTTQSIADTVSTMLLDKVGHLPPISHRSTKPNNVVYMYNKMYDNEWTDALDKLTQSGSRWAMDVTIKHLYTIMKVCFKMCKILERQQLQDLVDTVFLSDGGRRLPLTDIRPIMELRRKTAVDTAVNIKQNIFKMEKFQTELNKFSIKKEKLLKQIYETPFFGKCVYLCWCMTLEEPPLCLDVKEPPKGSVIDRDLYREFTKGGKRVKYCVWPPLLMKEDGEILVKGVVQAH